MLNRLQMKLKILKNTLVVDDMEIKEFPYPIRIAKEIQGTVIVVLDIPKDVIFSDNAYGYVLREQYLWQIEPHGYYPQVPASDICIIGISPMCRSWSSCIFCMAGKIVVCVNLLTGKVIKTEISKL